MADEYQRTAFLGISPPFLFEEVKKRLRELAHTGNGLAESHGGIVSIGQNSSMGNQSRKELFVAYPYFILRFPGIKCIIEKTMNCNDIDADRRRVVWLPC